MSSSSTSSEGTDKLIAKASELGAAVLREKTPRAARAYIGWIAELGPTIYQPVPGTLEQALDLAENDVLQANLRPTDQIANYSFFKNIAEIYGLDSRVASYSKEIGRLARSR